MTPSTKSMIAGTLVAGLVAVLKLIFQARAVREAAEAKRIADAELLKMRREAEERAARHAREAEERAEQAAERKADREQKEKLIAELQKSGAETLEFMKAQLKSQQEIGAKRYEIIERNTNANEKIASALTLQTQELRVMVDRIAKIEGGSGCRARPN